MTVQVITEMAKSPIVMPQFSQQDSVFPVTQADTVLADLTLYQRTGLRGEQAAQVLEQAGLSVPSSANQLTDSEQGTVLRLSAREFWLLSNVNGKALPELSLQPGCYPLLCQDSHAWFAFKSPFKAEVMAKLCAVDLREAVFSPDMIVQTVVAGVSAIVLHHRVAEQTVFSILCDRSVAHYLWDVMLDAMQEFGGKAVDISSLSGN